MKTAFTIGLLSLLCIAACPPRSGGKSTTSPAPQQNACASLTPQEQKFAEGLSAIHKHVFCSQFTSVQRAEAMAVVAPGKISPDEAIERVMQGSRGQTAPAPAPQKPKLNIVK